MNREPCRCPYCRNVRYPFVQYLPESIVPGVSFPDSNPKAFLNKHYELEHDRVGNQEMIEARVRAAVEGTLNNILDTEVEYDDMGYPVTLGMLYGGLIRQQYGGNDDAYRKEHGFGDNDRIV